MNESCLNVCLNECYNVYGIINYFQKGNQSSLSKSHHSKMNNHSPLISTEAYSRRAQMEVSGGVCNAELFIIDRSGNRIESAY